MMIHQMKDEQDGGDFVDVVEVPVRNPRAEVSSLANSPILLDSGGAQIGSVQVAVN